MTGAVVHLERADEHIASAEALLEGHPEMAAVHATLAVAELLIANQYPKPAPPPVPFWGRSR